MKCKQDFANRTMNYKIEVYIIFKVIDNLNSLNILNELFVN